MAQLCKVCKSEISCSYCPNCGAQVDLERINGRFILREIRSVLNFEKGFLYTTKQLLLRPGKNIRIYLLEDRNRLVKPIIYIILTSLIYTLAEQFLQFEDEYVNAVGLEESAVTAIFGWIQNNYGYTNIMMAVFIAVWIKVFFRKYGYNFFENLILLCFVMGISMIIYTLFGVMESFTRIQLLRVGGVTGLLYTSWAIGQFFDRSKKVNYLKGLFSYLVGMISFFGMAILLGVLIDLMSG